jgi:type IV pilus assembly protein PilP
VRRGRFAVAAAAALGVALLAARAGSQESEAPPAPDVSESMKALLEREVEPPPGAYTYSPAGRRDPFVSLIKPIEGVGQGRKNLQGMEGFLIQEVALKGIVKTKEGYIAMVVGPDTKAYFVTVGQRLFDGAITAMDQTSVTFRQEVTDPLSPVRVRDVRKSLYPSEEARQ